MSTIFGDRLLTPRLVLRKVGAGDIPLLVGWSGSVAAHGEYLTPECLEQTQGHHNVASGTYWNDSNRLFIVEKLDGEPIGTIHYWLRSENRSCGVVALKISDPSQRNQGFGTEAQKYLVIYLFDRLKLQRVEMYTDINNRPQQRCLAKLGFELVESLQYDDHQVQRLGHLYRLDVERYQRTSMYRYHYEALSWSAC